MGTSECIVVVVLTMISTTHELEIRVFITYNISTTILCNICTNSADSAAKYEA